MKSQNSKSSRERREAGGTEIVTEEGRHHDRGTDEEKDRSKEHQHGLGKTLFTRLELDVDDRGVIDGQKGSNGIQQAYQITHRQHDLVCHVSKSLSRQGIVRAAIADGSRKCA